MMDASHFDANEAYAAVDRHRLTDNEPHIYRTKDGGKVVAEDHARPAAGRLHADRQGRSEAARPAGGRNRARRVHLVQRRRRAGSRCSSICRRRRCAISPSTTTISSSRRTAAASGCSTTSACCGRSDPRSRTADAFLFKPSDAIIFPAATDDGTPTQKDEPWAESPPVGAIIDYYLQIRRRAVRSRSRF